jgi:DNA (cytosine-5)-methyltransferase 1
VTFGSLFTGIGGIDLGLERAGMTCKWQVEINPFCRTILNKHWPEVPKHGDITQLTGAELEPVDLIAGGFPCQDLSQAGKRVGIEGSRSGLWFEFARLIGILRPRYVLIENVPGLLVHDAMRRVVGELARLRYVGVWFSLRASDFRASHIRKRVFILAHSNAGEPPTAHDRHRHHEPGHVADRCDSDVADAEPSGTWPRPRESERATGLRRKRPGDGCESIMDHAERARSEIRNGQREQHVQPGAKSLAPGLPPFAPGPADERWPAILAERPDLAPALKSPVRGMADGIPDWMDRAMSARTKRLSRLGNAVFPEIPEWIGRRIIEATA